MPSLMAYWLFTKGSDGFETLTPPLPGPDDDARTTYGVNAAVAGAAVGFSQSEGS